MAALVHLHLVIQYQLLPDHGLAQIVIHAEARLQHCLHVGIEKSQDIAPGALGLIHRGIGTLQ